MSNERDYVFGGPDAEIDVLLMPRGDHTAAEVVQQLEAAGASEVAVLAPDVVSARVSREALAGLAEVADAHPKATKQLRRGR